MADFKQNNFAYGEPKEEFGDEEARQEFAKVSRQLREEADRIELPEALRAENLVRLLDDVAPGETKPVRKISLFREYAKWIAAAACLVLVISGFARMVARDAGAYLEEAAAAESPSETAAAQSTREEAYLSQIESAAPQTAPVPERAEKEAEEEAAPSGEMRPAENYTEIVGLLSVLTQENSAVTYGSVSAKAEGDAVTFNASARDAAPAAAPAAAEAGTGSVSGYTSTNVQVAGVDESDLLKTDGEYLYHRYTDGDGRCRVAILRAQGLEVLSTLELPDMRNAELYLLGDRLIVTGDVLWKSDAARETLGELAELPDDEDVIVPDWYDNDPKNSYSAGFLAFDISDRSAPVRTAAFKQSGSTVSTRLSEGVLYLVSNQWVDPWYVTGKTPALNVLPGVSVDGEGKILSAEDVFIPSSLSGGAEYCVVTAWNAGNAKAVTKAVLGSAQTVMMTGDTLLLASSLWDESGPSTGITRFDVGGAKALSYRSSGKIPGSIDGQFSLDVAEGLLRAATTRQKNGGETVSGVYVYDEKMDLIGSVDDIAPGERIYSVRFMGDTAYVVTFRQTDPLFAVDLSDPAHPKVMGQLKIPGFSEYLHPAGDGLLIGVGQNTRSTSWGGVIPDGLKLSLFDVSDPADPRELSSVLLGNSGSTTEVLQNHKAFLWDGENSRFGFPATVCRVYGATEDNPWGTNSDVVFDGYLVYTFDRKGFQRVGELSAEESDDPFAPAKSGSIRRAAVIGDTLYTAAEGGMAAWDGADYKKTESVVY